MESCDDFLETDPASGFTEEYVLSSEDEIMSLLTGIYSYMTTDNLYGRNLAYGFNTNTDVEMTSYTSSTPSAEGSDVGCFEARSTWTSLESTWNALYSAINYCNDFIESLPSSSLFSWEVGEDGPTEVQHMYGEAVTLRALLYLDLIRTWGDVVYTTTPTVAQTDYRVATTDRNVILDSLINQLSSVEHLMNYAEDLDYGVERASKEFCQALIGQMCMYRGGYHLRDDGTSASAVGKMVRADDYLDYYEKGVEWFGKVISEGKHNLDQSFEDMWYYECNWQVLNDGDVLFEVPMLKSYTSRYAYNIGVTITSGDHDYGSARNYCTFCGTYIFSFDKRDLRRDNTVVPYSYDEDLNQAINIGIASYGAGKWSKLKMESPLGSTSGSNTGVNSVRMRYADVLLMYAEALNELNDGPTTEAKEALKTVRQRAFAAADQAEMVEQYVEALTSKDDFFEAIMNERKWEFGGEGIRKYDLARWNKYGEVIYNLYYQLTNWALVANGQYVAGIDSVPSRIYYKSVDDEAHAGRTVLDFVGIDQYGDGVSRPSGYSTQDYAVGWRVLDNETGEYVITDAILYSFRGFIEGGSESGVSSSDPLRYLLPYPSQVITDHQGLIEQLYGNY